LTLCSWSNSLFFQHYVPYHPYYYYYYRACADAEDTGEIEADALFHLLHVDASLGLSEDECHNLVAAGDQDGSGVVG